MGEIRAVVFDLDGTLLDTLDDLTTAINYALEKIGALGHGEVSKGTVRRFVGNGVKKLVERALFFVESGEEKLDVSAPPQTDECLRIFTEFYSAHSADRTAPYPGITEAVRELVGRGIKIAVNTNKYEAAAVSLVKRFFGDGIAVVGARNGLKPKPYPDGALLALSALGEEKRNAVYVGDSETDIMTAHNAGIAVVAAAWGFRDRAALEALRPKTIADSPSSLVRAISMINSGERNDC